MNCDINNNILEKLMKTVEDWRLATVSSICANHQITAFHIAVLTEEKFRVYAMTGFLSVQKPLTAHIKMREDIFAAEWALRSLQLPNHSYTDIRTLRNSWDSKTADKCNDVLTCLKNYPNIRDLVICTKKGGYIVEATDDHTFVFKDTPNWAGNRDIKSRLISERVSIERNKKVTPDIIVDKLLEATPLYEDFPHCLRTSNYSGADFWLLWKWLFNLSISAISESSRVRSYRDYAATSDTKELTVIITKKKMIDTIVRETGLPKASINIFLKWLTFNSETPRKFTLFHCPLVEINDKFLMILPHTVFMAHLPTIFLRLLAHYDKTALNSASSALEKETLNRLKTHLEGCGHITKTNVQLDTSAGEMEIDFVEYDESDATICIGQAKLTIRADSVSEVDYTNQVLKKGLEQLEKNKSIMEVNRENIGILLGKLGVGHKENVNIEYFLLPTRFTGSDFLEIPAWVKVLPIEFCLQPQCKGSLIRSIWTQYKTLWDSIDTNVISSKTQSEFELAGFKIYYPCFTI